MNQQRKTLIIHNFNDLQDKLLINPLSNLPRIHNMTKLFSNILSLAHQEYGNYYTNVLKEALGEYDAYYFSRQELSTRFVARCINERQRRRMKVNRHVAEEPYRMKFAMEI